jgi:hypothetical protein
MNEETEILTTQDEEQTVAEDIRETIGDALQEAEPASATTEETEAPAEPEYTAKFNGYKPEEAEVLKKLPVDVQKIIDAREEKFHSGIEGYRERAEFAKTIEHTRTGKGIISERRNVKRAIYKCSCIGRAPTKKQ